VSRENEKGRERKVRERVDQGIPGAGLVGNVASIQCGESHLTGSKPQKKGEEEGECVERGHQRGWSRFMIPSNSRDERTGGFGKKYIH